MTAFAASLAQRARPPANEETAVADASPRRRAISGHFNVALSKDGWITPRKILAPLGRFGLDPCAHPEQPWPTADEMWSLPARDGLAEPWPPGVRVWLNPPFSEIAAWMAKMAEHGVGTAICLAGTEVGWFVDSVWRRATALLFLDKRPFFHAPDGRRGHANCGKGCVLAAYGAADAAILRASGLGGRFVRTADTVELPAGLCSTAVDCNHDGAVPAADAAYVAAHRVVYGPLGERVAIAALMFRDRIFRPGFRLPTVRLAPVAPYGKCMALSGNGGSLAHIGGHGLSEGVWLYLHEKFYGGEGLPEEVEETVLHELLHNELEQFGEDPAHKGAAWARRCAEISALLGLDVRIERVRSVRVGDRVTTGCPRGCLPYEELRRWPAGLLRGGPPLRQRVEVLPVLRSCELHEEAA